MKIVQVVHAFPPDIGGIEAHVFYLSKEMAKLGHDVTVITTKTRGANNNETVGGVKVIRYSALPLPIFSSVRFIPFLPLRLALIDADIYHSHGYGSTQPFFTSLAAHITNRPFVFTVHGYPKLKGFGGIMKWFYTNFPARVFFRIAKKIITVTDATIPDIEKEVSKEKIITIPNGVDFEKFKPSKKLSALDSNVIAYIGRFDAYKGIDTLICAFAIVQKNIPSAELRLIGRDEGIANSLKKLAGELGVTIQFSEANSEEMPKIYAGLSAVILPSKYEGLSLVLLEAIASGRPMLSTPVGASPKLFSEVYGSDAKKMLFEIGNPEELAGKILNVLGNKKKFEEICDRARKGLMASYSWGASAEKTILVYEGALGKGK
ncbi:MAG: glycosyltransferase family 4 protein [Candidatus Micrarchaeota archaeon]